MIDGVGNVSSVLVVGAANPLCLATVDRLVGPRLSRAFVLDSDAVGLIKGAQRIREFGIPDVTEVSYAVGDTDGQRQSIVDSFESGDIDVAIIGPSPQRIHSEPDAPTATPSSEYLTHALIDVLHLAELIGEAISHQGHGVLTLFTHSPQRIGTGLDPDYCAAMAALNLAAPRVGAAAAVDGGRTVCVALEPGRDPNAPLVQESRRSTMSPLEIASDLAPAITSRRKKRPAYEVIHLPKSLRKTAGRIGGRRG
mgnify:CR=1 FL=1